MLTALLLLLMSGLLPVQAEPGMITIRSPQAFPEAMLTLQESIRDHGYKVSRVQRIDIGLTGMGYETDKYRVVFFGKIDEVRHLSDKYPEMVPFLPPKFSIFAEGEQTLVVTTHPDVFKDFAPLGEDAVLMDRWTNDIKSILHDVANP